MGLHFFRGSKWRLRRESLSSMNAARGEPIAKRIDIVMANSIAKPPEKLYEPSIIP